MFSCCKIILAYFPASCKNYFMQPPDIADIEPQARRNIIRVATAYCKATGFKMSGVSRRAHGDAPFLENLAEDERRYSVIGHRTGKKGSFTLRVYDQLIKWFKANWPPDNTDFPVLDDLHHTPKEDQNGTSERQYQQSEGTEKACEEKTAGSGGTGSASETLARLRRRVDG